MSTPGQPPPSRQAYAIGAAAQAFDVRSLWESGAEDPDGWERELSASKELAGRFAAVAEQALRSAGVRTPAAIGCTVASVCGFGHLAEWIHKRLSDRGPAWLEPDAFVYCQPHAVTGLTCLRLGLTGSAMTLIGPDAGRQALDHAIRSLRRERTQLAGAYEVVSPQAARRLARLGVRTDPHRARAAFVVLAERPRETGEGVRLR
jgi:hypothetical protein